MGNVYIFKYDVFLCSVSAHASSRNAELIQPLVIYFYMCARLTKRKSQVKSYRFQIHPTTLVMNIFYTCYIFMLVKHAHMVSQRFLDFDKCFARKNLTRVDQSSTLSLTKNEQNLWI